MLDVPYNGLNLPFFPRLWRMFFDRFCLRVRVHDVRCHGNRAVWALQSHSRGHSRHFYEANVFTGVMLDGQESTINNEQKYSIYDEVDLNGVAVVKIEYYNQLKNVEGTGAREER